jgi:ATP/maltotriose-dependent transcriptional regulator MalT
MMAGKYCKKTGLWISDTPDTSGGPCNCSLCLRDKRIAELEAELATLETKQSAERGQLYLQVDDLKADSAMLRSRLRQARELIDEVASQCPEENDWLDVARRWLAAEIGGEMKLEKQVWSEANDYGKELFVNQALERISTLEAALREIQGYCAGRAGSVPSVVAEIARKALKEGSDGKS